MKFYGVTDLKIEQMSIPSVQLIYGGVAAFASVLFLIFAREAPPTLSCLAGQEVRVLMLDGLTHVLKIRLFWLFLLVFFAGMGIFNGIDTWIEGIIRPRGFNLIDSGTIGAVMLVGGWLGVVVMLALSDKQRRRPDRHVVFG